MNGKYFVLQWCKTDTSLSDISYDQFVVALYEDEKLLVKETYTNKDNPKEGNCSKLYDKEIAKKFYYTDNSNKKPHIIIL